MSTIGLADSQKVLILMTVFSPETASQLFQAMNPEVVEALYSVYSRGEMVSDPVAAEVVEEFLAALGGLQGFGPIGDLDELEALARKHPRLVVKLLKRTWPGPYREVASRRSRVLRSPAKLP